jgi:hypothetical protein
VDGTGGVTGWEVTEYAIALTAIIAAGAAIWKAVGVVRNIRDGVDFVGSMMRPNGGSSVIDRLERLEVDVSVLLKHDRDRDQPGKRYQEED